MHTDENSAHATWRELAGQLEKSNPTVTEMMGEPEAGVLGEDQLHQHTGTFEQRGEAARDIVGIFPTKRA